MGKRSLIIFTGVVIGVLVLGAGALYAYDHGHRDKIAKGVAVAGIDVGGLSAAQARARLQREYLPRFEQPVVVRFHAHRFKLSPRAAGVTVDVNAAVDEALAAKPRRVDLHARVARADRRQRRRRHPAAGHLLARRRDATGRAREAHDRPPRPRRQRLLHGGWTRNGAVAERPRGQDRSPDGRPQRRARASRATPADQCPHDHDRSEGAHEQARRPATRRSSRSIAGISRYASTRTSSSRAATRSPSASRALRPRRGCTTSRTRRSILRGRCPTAPGRARSRAS